MGLLASSNKDMFTPVGSLLKRVLTSYQDQRIRYFLLCMLVFGVTNGLYIGVLNNYLHDILGLSRVERGLLEMPRELPGLLLFLSLAVLFRSSEIRILILALLLCLFGLVGLAAFGTDRLPAVLMIVLWSWGEHLTMPTRQSIAIHSARKGREGAAMGGVSSVRTLGQVIGTYLVLPVFLFVPVGWFIGPYRLTFLIAAAFLLLAFLTTSRLRGWDRTVKREKLYFRKKYLKYYILEIFFGARKQVFITFAPYVLILNYGARTELIASLQGIWALVNIFIAPLVGRLLDRIGYKKMIMIDTSLLVLLCLTYGFAHRVFPYSTAFIIVCGVFVLDAVLFTVGIARAMYVKTIARSRDEVTSTLSAGLSINHLVSIVIAMLGGLLWQSLGIETLFSLAALFGLGSFIYSLTLPGPKNIPIAEGE